MAEFPTYMPDSFVPRTYDPVSEWLIRNEQHAIVQKLMVYYGAATIPAMTNPQRAAMFSAVQIWQITREAEVNDATQTASIDANDSAVNDFIP